jgi:hypothetical protein
VSDPSNEGFLSRWSRRKAQVRQGDEGPPVDRPLPAAPAPAAVPVAMPAAVPAGGAVPSPTKASEGGAAGTAPTHGPPTPPPTLEDVAQLSTSSNFARFVAPDVDPAVKNAAMKKLFADPHFNVMDGLDTYIDDYHTVEPLPKSMLRQMVQARVLGLLDDDLEDQQAQAAARAPAGPVDDPGPAVATTNEAPRPPEPTSTPGTEGDSPA